MRIWTQKSASIQKRTSLPKFGGELFILIHSPPWCTDAHHSAELRWPDDALYSGERVPWEEATVAWRRKDFPNNRLFLLSEGMPFFHGDRYHYGLDPNSLLLKYNI